MSDKVIVITINYNQTKFTLDCIDSLLKSDYPNFQILLIDNVANQENSQEFEQKLPADERLIFKRIYPNRGYVGGLNYGLSLGADLGAEYFLIMNNDTIIDKSAISELVRTCKIHNNNAIVSGKVYHYEDPERLQYVGAALVNEKTLKYKLINNNEIDDGQYNIEKERDMLDDIYWVLPNKLITQIGRYNEYFWFNSEQMDFALRAKKIGYKLIYTPKAKLWHKGSITQGGREYNPRIAYYSMQSSLIVRYMHLSGPNFLVFYINTLFSVFITSLKAVAFFILGRRNLFKYSYAKFKGLTYFNSWLINKRNNSGENPF